MQWEWQAWLQTPQAIMHSPFCSEFWLAWQSTQSSMMWLLQMAQVSTFISQDHRATAFHFLISKRCSTSMIIFLFFIGSKVYRKDIQSDYEAARTAFGFYVVLIGLLVFLHSTQSHGHQLFNALLDVLVRLRTRLNGPHPQTTSQVLRLLHRDLPELFQVALVAHHHNGNLFAFPNLLNEFDDAFHVLEGVLTVDGVDYEEGLALADPVVCDGHVVFLSSGVHQLQHPDVAVDVVLLVVAVLQRGVVHLFELPLDVSHRDTRLPHRRRPKHHHLHVRVVHHVPWPYHYLLY